MIRFAIDASSGIVKYVMMAQIAISHIRLYAGTCDTSGDRSRFFIIGNTMNDMEEQK
jgi:hypothetical protein